MRELDLAIFRWINSWPDWLNPFFQFFSEGNKWWWVRIGLLLFLITILWIKKTRLAAVAAMVAWPLANAACDALKASFQALRPSAELYQLTPDHLNAIVRVERLTSFGTASAHSANMASIAIVLWFADKRLGIAWAFVALFTGLSRIYVGVHYPYQVLFGWFVGFMVGVVVWATFQSFVKLRAAKDQQQNAPKPESDP